MADTALPFLAPSRGFRHGDHVVTAREWERAAVTSYVLWREHPAVHVVYRRCPGCGQAVASHSLVEVVL